MQLISVNSAKHTATPLLELAITADLGDGAGPQPLPYGWAPGDPHGLGPQIDAYMAANPSFPIAAYSPPPPSTNPNDYPLRPDQFFAMLDIAGLTNAVNTAIAAIPDATQRAIAKAKLNHTLIFERSNPLFNSLKGAVGMTDAQIDAMWMQAKGIP